jgi:hypothetical protein
MPPPGVRGAQCRAWDRGLDCGFREDRFHAVAAVVWFTTVLVTIPIALRLARHNKSHCARPAVVLHFVTLASALRGLDHTVYLLSDGASGYGTFMGAATVLLIFAVETAISRWADVVGVKAHREANREAKRRIWAAQLTMRLVVLMQVPASLYNSFQASYGWGCGNWSSICAPSTWHSFDEWVMIYVMVGVCTLGVGCSIVALLMYAVSVRLKLYGSSLHMVSVLNLGEQVLYNVIYATLGVLYFVADFDANGVRDFDSHGFYQALLFYLGHLVGLWLMHAQVVAFFFVCAVEDPFRSDEHYELLLEGRDKEKRKKIESPTIGYLDDAQPIAPLHP